MPSIAQFTCAARVDRGGEAVVGRLRLALEAEVLEVD